MFKLRKIAAVLAGMTMIGSTVALAAAANYPAPFVSGGNADVAIVYGSTAANTDLVAVADINTQLQAKLAEQTATTSSSTSVTTTGEVAPLFTGSTSIYVNDSLNTVQSALTKRELPTVLADGSFSGNVDATYTQTITLGSNPTVTFAKQPTSSDNPAFGLTLSTNTATPIYNASVTFNKAINLTHADSKGQDLTLFGQKYTIASATSTTDIVLLKQAQKVDLTSDAPTTKVTIGGKEYTIELVSASDYAATVRVTDSTGASDSKEVSENASKKIQGLTVAVLTADETNLRLSASVLAGAEKVTLTDAAAVTMGDDADPVDGTLVTFNNATTDGAVVDALTKITVSVAAPNSDSDAILPGKVLTDPIFGTFKIDFATSNAPENSSARELVSFKSSGDDKLYVTFTDSFGITKELQFIENKTGCMLLQPDADGRNITVSEGKTFHKNDYVVVGNEEYGRLLKLTTVTNQSNGYGSDKVRFTDVMSGDPYDVSISGEGIGTVPVGGKFYSVTYQGSSSSSEEDRNVTLNYPDSSGAGSMILYPTMKTSKGAKIAFYKSLNITTTSWDGSNQLTQLRIPNGNGYVDTTVTNSSDGQSITLTDSAGTASIMNLTEGSVTANITAGELIYEAEIVDTSKMQINLLSPSDGAKIFTPAVVLIEEKDDNVHYNGIVITPTVSAGKVGVNTILGTQMVTSSSLSMPSDSDVVKTADLFGSIITVDSSDSNQHSGTISYPDEQVYAQIYAAANSAEISAASSSGSSTGVKSLGSVTVADSEVSSVSAKNLIVVGGNCVNSVAAKLLGTTSSGCGAEFETLSGVVGGQFLIQTLDSPYATGKVATLVAGRYAADTTNAAKYLTTQAVDTTVGKKYKGTSATVATLETTTA